MDVDRHVVSVGGEPVPMPLKEFELLELLLRNAGRVLTRGQLIDRVWGSDYVGDTKTLDVHVKRLRAKVEPDPGNPRHIVTVRGLGYKLETLSVAIQRTPAATRRSGGGTGRDRRVVAVRRDHDGVDLQRLGPREGQAQRDRLAGQRGERADGRRRVGVGAEPDGRTRRRGRRRR